MSPFFSSCNNGDDQSCCFGLGKVQLQYVSIGSKSDHHDKSLGVMEVLIIMVLTLNSCFFFCDMAKSKQSEWQQVLFPFLSLFF